MGTGAFSRPVRAALQVIAFFLTGAAWAEAELPAFNIDITQTTVSGISSGAFMAVQFGTAHSAAVRGVAATAGGPYFCAGQDSWAGAGVDRAIARCMQGDPSYPAQPITDADMAQMQNAVRTWAGRGLIDPVENLAKQRVWLFHGYNDGIVKKPVGDALYQWYSAFVPASQIFYKDQLPAAHAQISASCSAGSKVCKPCAITGGDFINACTDGDGSSALYDAAGAALQLFYGPLTRTATAALSGKVQSFSQKPYVQRAGGPVAPIQVSMADTGYLYVPAACAAGEACRLHVAFHGCQQQAGRIKTAFVKTAGFNEWADANHIVVLYPQTAAATAVPATPFNPQGCWDWWGYNDFGYDAPGHYATHDGAQIAAVWRMVQRLSGGSGSVVTKVVATTPTAPALQVIDTAPRQVALTWQAVAGAAGYRVYRNQQPLPDTARPGLVDAGLAPSATVVYQVSAVDALGKASPLSAPITAKTPALPPPCDPYFSLQKDMPVTRENQPTRKTCP